MRWLIGSDLEPNINSGAAGTIQRHAEALQELGESVDLFWRRPLRFQSGDSLRRVLELPWIQSEQILSMLRRRKYDVVLTSQPHAALAYRLLSKMHPTILRLNRTHGWEARYAASEHLWSRFEAPRGNAQAFVKEFTSALVERQGRQVLRLSHGLIVPSSRCAQHMASEVPTARAKIRCIPWGTEEQQIDIPEKTGSLRIAFVAQFVPRKGFDLLPEIVRQLEPSAQLLVVTNKAGLPWVEARLRPMLGERLSVSDWLPRSQLMDLMRAQDVLLTLSFFEGFCKVFVEAMASGLCVVGFDEGGLSDIANHGENSLYTDVNDVGAVVRLLNTLAKDPAQARRLGRSARAVAENLTWRICAERTLEFARQRSEGLKGAALG